MALSPGTRIGPYEILGILGTGGMGEVYKARDTRLERMVAIKVAKQQFTERFEGEARAISALNHPNICTLYDVGPNYLVMEFIDGSPIKGPLPLDQALKAAAQIAGALDAAHRKGIVHRDLKPANILVTKSGLKLLDFGLAKREGSFKPAVTEETVTQAHTQEGSIVGTMQYMAPEQLQGQEADFRSDIFSFGLVLYEILTGRRAFEAANSASLIAAIMTAQPPPISSLLPVSPPALDRVLMRCLAKDPDERWQSARDLKAEIEWLAGGSSALAAPAAVVQPTARPKRFWLPWLLAAALASVAAAIGWIHWSEKPAPAPLVRFTVDPPPGERFYRYSWPAVSPDGARILFAVDPPPSGGGPRLWMYRVSTGESAPFQNLPYNDPRWSADSSSIAIPDGNMISRVDLTGLRSEVLREKVSDFAWGPAGSYFFGIAEKGLFWVEKSAGRKQVTVQKSAEGLHELPQALPDGKSFLFVKRQTTALETWLAPLDGKDPKLLLSKASQALFAPPDYLLYLEGGSLVAQRFDAGRGTLIGDARTLVSGVASSPNSPYGWFSVSRNGVLVFRQGAVTNPSRLTWYGRSGNVTGTLGEAADYSNPALSPDGQRLAVCIRDTNGKRDIWVFDLTRGTKTAVTFDPADESNPTWSPDGSEIAYSSDRRGRRDIYAKSSFGTGPERTLLESSEDKTVLDWSSDGKLIYSVLNPKSSRELWVLPLTASQHTPSPLFGVPYRQDEAVVSPDGHAVIYRSQESSRGSDLYLQPLPNGQRWQLSTASGGEPQWRGDGREIFYFAHAGMMAAEVSAQGAPGPPKALFPVHTPTQGRNRFIVSKDGQRFLMITPEETRDPATTPFVVILNWPRLLEDR
ncbi:MAG: protein kinase domain-containing protein [Bryobacteraceae bacterium]